MLKESFVLIVAKVFTKMSGWLMIKITPSNAHYVDGEPTGGEKMMRHKKSFQKRRGGSVKYSGVSNYKDGDINQKLEGQEMQFIIRFPIGKRPPEELFRAKMCHSPEGNMQFIIGIGCSPLADEGDTEDCCFHVGFN